MSQATADVPSRSPEKPENPRTAWERIVTSTPVVLTVVATILAGLSSSEMTRAMYYRAMAAQHQAKVSDQWNFFQAKRIRGTSMDMTISVLRSASGAGRVSMESLQSTAGRLPSDYQRSEEEADALLKAVAAAHGELGAAADPLREAAERFRAADRTARASGGKLAEALAADKVQKALEYLTAGTLPESNLTPEKRQEMEAALADIDRPMRDSLNYVDPELLTSLHARNSAIPQALAEINARKTEAKMSNTLARISEEEIASVIDAGEDKAAAIEHLGKPPAAIYKRLDDVIAEQALLARSLQRAAQNVSLATAAIPSGEGKTLSDVRLAASAVARSGAELRATTDELGNDFKAAQLSYDSRRYEREARSNQAVAGLYELNVRKASLTSDRHRDRSMKFFFAMLAAQAGVTIATFSLAVRFRSVLWMLATAAGLIALAFAAYVYLKM